jgi:hypothetical protein
MRQLTTPPLQSAPLLLPLLLLCHPPPTRSRLAASCWSTQPSKRPRATELVTALTAHLAELKVQQQRLQH